MESKKAYYGLPSEVHYCKKCVISNQRPSSTVEYKNRADVPKTTISFDEEGVCAPCRFTEIKNTVIDWKEREHALWELCDVFRSKKGNYDCIVPGSGGKDSAFTSHILKHKFKMNPLTVTWSPHIYTDVGLKNFQNWINSGFDNILFTPNGKVHRLLSKLAFENLLHPFQPFILGQKYIAPRLSTKFGIPLVFYGENQAEYGNNIEDNSSPKMGSEYYVSNEPIENIHLGGLNIGELENEHNISPSDLQPYLPLSQEEVKETNIEFHYLGYYLKWDPQECYYYASENTAFQPDDQRTESTFCKYNSIDDKIDTLHYHTLFIKFGIGRATYDAAQEIRNGKISREEGVALVKKYDGEFPNRYLTEILEYLDMSKERLMELIDAGRSPHLWHNEGEKWKLRSPIWEACNQ